MKPTDVLSMAYGVKQSDRLKIDLNLDGIVR